MGNGIGRSNGFIREEESRKRNLGILSSFVQLFVNIRIGLMPFKNVFPE